MPNGQNTAPINPALLQRFIEGTSPDERSSLLDKVPTSALMPFKSGDHTSLLSRAAQSAPDMIQKAMEGWSKKPVNAEFLRTAGEPGAEGAPQQTGLLELLQGILGSLDPATLQGLLGMLLGMGSEGAMPPMGMEPPMEGPPMGMGMEPPMGPPGPPMGPPGPPMGPPGMGPPGPPMMGPPGMGPPGMGPPMPR